MGAGVVVAGEAARMPIAHGWSDSRWPFIFAAASLQTKQIASAICSAGVKVGYALSGFSLAHRAGSGSR